MTTLADVLPATFVRSPAKARNRSVALDALRGLAVALMIADHLLLRLYGPVGLRQSVTRLAMPLFFVLAGHLCRRLTWRHGAIFAVGLYLPVVVPWIDSPNVLAWYALGAVLLRVLRTPGQRAVLVGVGLTLYANGYGYGVLPHSYNPFGLWALMALGALLPRESFAWGVRLPRIFARLGRYPLSVYVGHLLLLTVLT